MKISFRYYYDKSLLTKMPGKRYAYRFDFPALKVACEAQQNPMPSDTKDAVLAGIMAPFLGAEAGAGSQTSSPVPSQSPASSAQSPASPRYHPPSPPPPPPYATPPHMQDLQQSLDTFDTAGQVKSSPDLSKI